MLNVHNWLVNFIKETDMDLQISHHGALTPFLLTPWCFWGKMGTNAEGGTLGRTQKTRAHEHLASQSVSQFACPPIRVIIILILSI